MAKLAHSHPFLGVGPGSIISRDRISNPVTFGTPENYRMESVIFDVVEVNLPFNAILDRLALYQFMVVAHYGNLVLKMSGQTTSSRSTEIAPPMSLHWRSSKHWRWPRRALLATASRTRHPQVHASMA
jgi:hypothetical protein